MARYLFQFLVVLVFWLLSIIPGLSFDRDKSAYIYSDPEGIMGYVQTILLGIGAAAFIAALVALLVEQDHFDKMQQLRKKADEANFVSMFKRAFGTFFDDDMIRESIDAIFSSRIARERLSINYTFDKHKNSEFLFVVRVDVEFDVRNISPTTDAFEFRVMLPNMMARYPSDPLREKPEILSVWVNGQKFSPDEIRRLNSSIKIDDANPRLELKRIELKPDEVAKLRWEYKILKLSHDSETQRMAYPTRGANISVLNNIGNSTKFDIEPILSRSFQPDQKYSTVDGKKLQWKEEGMFLPQNGWVLYWNSTDQNPSGASEGEALGNASGS